MGQYSRESDEERAQRRAGIAAASTASASAEAAVRTPTAAPDPAPSARSEVPAPATAAGDAVPAGMQYLYGSGEAVAASLQAYLALSDWISSRATARQIGQPIGSVVLAPGSTPSAPRYLPCGEKPLAVVLDIDETSLLNLGFEDTARSDTSFDAARWEAWERTGAGAVAAVPGVLDARAAAAAVGVAFVFNSNRAAANAAATAATLARVGLGPAVHGDTLWLQGDAGGGSGKDARREAIARKYCVIALVGDQLGDFSDQFNAAGTTPASRRALAASDALGMIWGHGWFILPNPVYGTALKGRRDDVFPADKRWTPPAEGAPR